MEPRKQEQGLEQTQEPRPEEKPRRFRLVKLEERIAPYWATGSRVTSKILVRYP
jgi:hypothetical protein